MIQPPSALTDAPEEERALAASAAIAKLRIKRAEMAARTANAAAIKSTESVTETPTAFRTAVNGLRRPQSKTPVVTSRLTDAEDYKGLTDSADSKSPFPYLGSISNRTALAGVAGLGLAAGFILSLAFRGEPDQPPAQQITSSQTVANEQPVVPEQPVENVQNLAAEQAAAEQVLAAKKAENARAVSELQSLNRTLQSQVDSLERETTALQNELLQVELQLLNPTTPTVRLDEIPVTNLTNIPSNEFTNTTIASNTQSSFVQDTRPEVRTNSSVSETVSALTDIGIDEVSAMDIADAHEHSRNELDVLENLDTQNTAEERDKTRRAIEEELASTIGIENVAAVRYALGEPNLLIVTDVSDPLLSVLPGDILISVNGQRVIDLNQVRWIQNDAEELRISSGISTESHVLEVIRDGQQISLVFDASLSELVLISESVPPNAFNP